MSKTTFIVNGVDVLEENEKLKKYIKDLQVRKDRYYLQALEYEKALEELVYLLQTEEPFCYCSCGDEIIDKINEVLGAE